jgi:FKBP-type peptidyl-prolyl cis-trans isomerase FkpA
MRVINRQLVVLVSLVSLLGNFPQIAMAGRQGGMGSNMNEVTTPTGLVYVDEVVGTGEVARPGQTVSVHYTGWLTNGQKFDSSLDRGQPFQFALGGGQVIRGWDEGVAGMKVGGKRKLIIPPNLGYGSNGAGALIPPNSKLVFEVQLLGVQ